MVPKEQNKMKVLAYKIEHDTSWEPGVPDRDHSDYWELSEKSCRGQTRQDGFFMTL
jgi:hypothetical protein